MLRASSKIENNNRAVMFFKTAYKQRWLYIFTLPGFIFFLIFSYIPILGIIMAFQYYDPILGFFKSAFVGYDNFRFIFHMPEFMTAFKNTFIISGLKLCIGFPLGIIFAILLNEIRNTYSKRIIQTISYLPYFISWVVAAGIWYKFLSVDHGVVNDLLLALNIVEKPIYFLGENKYFYSIVIAADQWKNLGFNAIIYLSALSGIHVSQYEAAGIDGAGRFRKIWHISLPGIKNIIVLLLILNTAALASAGFDQMWTFGNISVRETSEILDTLVLRTLTTAGISGLSIGAAMGLFQSTIGLLLFVISNMVARLLKEDSIL